ncbi:ATP/GTP-binding protein [Kitasatospora sp. CMC57]|uniref:ATP/GTP-binding protein n=2 Tax=Kitasatospora sp. CMC57 TaxID=3231513 RepID=A0AB33JWN2_9ACTN
MVRVLLMIGMLAATITPAAADEPGGTVTPCATRDICISVHEPGSTSSGNPGGKGETVSGKCYWQNKEIACWDDELGWFSGSTGCYYLLTSPKPPADNRAWGGRDPATGEIYQVSCRDGSTEASGPQFFAAAPAGPPPSDNVVTLRREALANLHLAPPAMHAAPTGDAVVGAPLWLWYDRSPASVGPLSATAKGNVISVTATAQVRQVSWDMDDGHTVSCDGAGTPYRADLGRTESPDCRYVYRSSSAHRADGKLYLVATAIWRVTATRSDNNTSISFDYPVPAASPLPLRVAEVQLLN